jgi:hypothetical protein
MKNWQIEILKHHKGQTGFFKQLEELDNMTFLVKRLNIKSGNCVEWILSPEQVLLHHKYALTIKDVQKLNKGEILVLKTENGIQTFIQSYENR